MEQGAATLLSCFKLIFMIMSALSNPGTEKHQSSQAIPSTCLSLEELTDQEGLTDEYGHKASQGVTTHQTLLPLEAPLRFIPLPQPHILPLPWPPALPAPPSHQPCRSNPASAEFSPPNWFNASFDPLLAEQILFPQSKGQGQATSINHSRAAVARTAWNFSPWAHSTCSIRCPRQVPERTGQHSTTTSNEMLGSTAVLEDATETGAAQLCKPYAAHGWATNGTERAGLRAAATPKKLPGNKLLSMGWTCRIVSLECLLPRAFVSEGVLYFQLGLGIPVHTWLSLCFMK